MRTRGPIITFWPITQLAPMSLPPSTCEKCQIRVPAPIATSSSMIALGCTKYSPDMAFLSTECTVPQISSCRVICNAFASIERNQGGLELVRSLPVVAFACAPVPALPWRGVSSGFQRSRCRVQNGKHRQSFGRIRPWLCTGMNGLEEMSTFFVKRLALLQPEAHRIGTELPRSAVPKNDIVLIDEQFVGPIRAVVEYGGGFRSHNRQLLLLVWVQP